MDMNLIFGVVFLAMGVVTLVGRIVAPDHPRLFAKLGPMRERWGYRGGTALHVVSYTVVPLVAGGLMVLLALL